MYPPTTTNWWGWDNCHSGPVFFADTGGSNAKQEPNDDRVIVIDDEDQEMIKVNAKNSKVFWKGLGNVPLEPQD